MALEHLLISDLDDTLLGDDAALKRFAEYFHSLHPRVIIAYATGRDFESVVKDVDQTELPVPVAVISSVGSEIHHFSSRSMVASWTRNLAGNWSADRIRELMEEESEVELQPDTSQSDYKASFFVPQAAPRRLEELRDRIARAGIQADYVYSSDRDLDFLPKGVNKGSAAVCLARELGFDLSQVMVAGNSANDAALFQIGCAGIVVSNAHPELKQRMKGVPHVYFSRHPLAEGTCYTTRCCISRPSVVCVSCTGSIMGRRIMP